MAHRSLTRIGLAGPLAAVLVALTAGAVFAGEVTGTGEETAARERANSICAYSGQNDDPEGEDPANGPPGRTQSYGQDVRAGFFSPAEFNPGDACRGGSNPNREE